jgi:hypothetical protein
MEHLTELLRGVLRSLGRSSTILLNSLVYIAKQFWSCLTRLLRGKVRDEEEYERSKCLEIPPDVARRPDPCLYSQRYLADQGIAITWNNPDIVITNLDGSPAALPLDANRDYLVKGRIHNASFDPALGVAVRCFVRPWGIDFSDRTPVEVDAAGNPAQRMLSIGAWGDDVAEFSWRTPDVEGGHYCVTVECFHPADREPANNVGQENTDVRRRVSSGGSLRLVIPFYNRSETARDFRVAVDEYQIPDNTVTLPLRQIHGVNGLTPEERRLLLAQVRVDPVVLENRDRLRRFVERDAMRGARIRLRPMDRPERRGVGYRVFAYEGVDQIRRGNDANDFLLGGGWEVDFPDAIADFGDIQLVVPPGSTAQIVAVVRAPAHAAFRERKQINVTIRDGADRVVGGVTLDIELEAEDHA